MATSIEGRIVYLGNRNAIEIIEDPDSGEQTRRPLPGKLRTTVIIPADWPLMQAAAEITAGNSLWKAHSDDPGPAWVASTDPQLGGLLASFWGCELRDPEPDSTPDTSAEE